MLTFRQKILFVYISSFFLFIAVMIPFANESASSIMYKAMLDRIDELLEVLEESPNEVGMIALLKEQKPTLFYRVTLINDKRQILYDTHTRRLIGGSLLKEQPIHHAEVEQAFREGIGYQAEYSNLLHQDFSYLAKTFHVQGQTYVLRISFPLRYVLQITKDFRYGFIVLSSLLLLFYGLITWALLQYLTRPIHKIIEAIRPYQEGRVAHIPELKLSMGSRSDEFIKLGETLNSLSKKIQTQINTLIVERQEKELLLESLDEGVVACDHQGCVVYANQRALELYGVGYKKDLFLGEGVFIEKSLELIAKARQEAKTHSEMLEWVREGHKMFYAMTAIALEKELGSLLVVQDQTSQMRVIEMKREFVANASHELRTPLTIIQGFAETLENPNMSKEQMTLVTQKILRSCTKMTSMIAELLLLSDLDRLSPTKMESFDLDALLHKIRDQLLLIYPQASLEIHGKVGVIRGVPNLLERAFMNLMDNGCKYSPGKKHVEVHLRQEGARVEVRIEDQGMGIPAKDLPFIFQRFYRASTARSKEFVGSGLGLSIVETIIAKHGGKISVRSQEGQGTCFLVSLPIASSTSSQACTNSLEHV